MSNAEFALERETTTAPKGLRIGLWVAQVLLALAFGMAGFMKLTTPIDKLQAMMPWVNGLMGNLVRFIAAVELAGAVGMILPAATRIQPRLTPLAAGGLALTMLLAAATHIARGELSMIGAPILLGGLAAFVAWGRGSKAPILPR